MNLKDLEEFSKKIPGKLLFDYNLNKSNYCIGVFENEIKNQGLKR